MEISFTRFRVYLECPWKYKLMFVDGQRVPLDPPSALGLSLHRALERFHKGRAHGLEALLDCYDKGWIAGGYPDDKSREEWRKKGARILRRYYETESGRRTEVVGAEREFAYPLGRHAVRGMVDRIDRHPDGAIEVIDYKTSLDDDAAARPAEALQLRFYALGVRECLALEPSLLTIHYLAAGRRESAPYDPAGEEELKALILRTADRIEAGDFKPDASFCPRCEFRRACSHSTAKAS